MISISAVCANTELFLEMAGSPTIRSRVSVAAQQMQHPQVRMCYYRRMTMPPHVKLVHYVTFFGRLKNEGLNAASASVSASGLPTCFLEEIPGLRLSFVMQLEVLYLSRCIVSCEIIVHVLRVGWLVVFAAMFSDLAERQTCSTLLLDRTHCL